MAGLQELCDARVATKRRAYHLGFSARAVNTLVGPISARHARMAPGLAKTKAQIGPLVMKFTRFGKKGLPLCSP